MMKRAFRFGALTLVLLAALVACQSVRNGLGPELRERPEGALRIGSYNVHYIDVRQSKGRWSRGMWERRKAPLDATFKALDADLVAFQEMESFAGGNEDSDNLARSWLLVRNPGYAAAAVGDWRAFPSTQPILYRVARLELADQGWFFFSETPDVIYSRTFNGSYPAFASWAAFRDRQSGAAFRVVNVHTDYGNRENRTRSIALVADRIGPWIAAGETVFVSADLNARLGSDLHAMLEEAGVTFVPVEGATYHFDMGINLFAAIDHIGFAGAEPLGPPMVFREKLGEVWPTDHYPLVADFRLDG